MADVIKLVPSEGVDADDVLNDALGQHEEVIIIGWGPDGFSYATNATTYGDMLLMLRLCEREILDDSLGE
jgi:hypothetical protein